MLRGGSVALSEFGHSVLGAQQAVHPYSVALASARLDGVLESLANLVQQICRFRHEIGVRILHRRVDVIHIASVKAHDRAFEFKCRPNVGNRVDAVGACGFQLHRIRVVKQSCQTAGLDVCLHHMLIAIVGGMFRRLQV